MNIAPISLSFSKINRNVNFCSGKESSGKIVKDTSKHITKAFLEKTENVADTKISDTVSSDVTDNFSIFSPDKLLADKGITYCKANGNVINIGTGQIGFFTVKTSMQNTTQQAKEHLVNMLKDSKIAFGGLLNYINCVKDLKRQDIIQKGLKIHSYQLNYKVPFEGKENAVFNLKKILKKNIKLEDIFFIDNEAFYYNDLTKTAYGINYNLKYSDKVKPKIRTCEFITNKSGNAIGYKRNDWDAYGSNYIETEYIEQQEPGSKLLPIIEPFNTKDLAEAYRFGNVRNIDSIKERKLSKSIPIVLEHLANKAKIKNVTSDKLQIARFYDEDRNIFTRICYYNAETGRSYAYDENGDYLRQVEYLHDHEGILMSCNGF